MLCQDCARRAVWLYDKDLALSHRVSGLPSTDLNTLSLSRFLL